MKAFNRVFLAAILAGGIAGLLLAGIQHFTITPLILEAESFEATDSDEGNANQGEEAWAPADGAERTFFAAMNSVIVGIGFGLLLTACYALRGAVTWRRGILWGLAGFAVFLLAPSFVGLPAKLPGDEVAELGMQQTWWWLTVIVTAAGLWIIAFQPVLYLKLFGVALIILPHLFRAFGAPQPEVQGGLAPEELRNTFIILTSLASAIFWVVLGILSAYFFERIGESQRSAA